MKSAIRSGFSLLALSAVLVFVTSAVAAPVMPAPGPGEQVVYQTVQNQSSPQWHTFITQVTGNASINSGDEIRLGAGTTNRFVSHIAISTQTFSAPATPAYTPAFVEASIWLNDGPPAGGDFLVPQPGTLVATSRVPGPSYPAGGNHTPGGIIIDFPFSNVLVPGTFTVAIINLNAAGQPDGANPDGNQWGPYLSTGATTNVVPGSGGPDFNNTTYNTNVAGNSRTGPFISASNNGHWRWSQSGGSGNWGNGRSSNTVMDMTIYAVVPEPASVIMAGFGIVGLVLASRRRRPRD